MKTPLTLGLTGNIAAGKSAVAGLLADRGALVVDCDALAREVVALGTPGLAEVVAEFGSGVLAADGGLDRAALAARVFDDPAALARLEALLHPLIRAARDARLAAADAAVRVVEAVKLVESGFHRDCDAVWLVTADRATRRRRLIEQRGLSTAEADARLAAMPDEAAKEALADRVIRNDGDRAALAREVAAAWAELVDPRARQR